MVCIKFTEKAPVGISGKGCIYLISGKHFTKITPKTKKTSLKFAYENFKPVCINKV